MLRPTAALFALAILAFPEPATAQSAEPAAVAPTPAPMDPAAAKLEQALAELTRNPTALDTASSAVAATLGPSAVATLREIDKIGRSGYRSVRPSQWFSLAQSLSQAEMRSDFFLWSGQTQRDLSATDAPPPETLKYLFRYYAAVGVAAEYSNDPQPPFFEYLNGVPVNYYFYLAARMCACDAELTKYAIECAPLSAQEMQTWFPQYGEGESGLLKSVWYYVDQINKGAFGSLKETVTAGREVQPFPRPAGPFAPVGKREE